MEKSEVFTMLGIYKFDCNQHEEFRYLKYTFNKCLIVSDIVIHRYEMFMTANKLLVVVYLATIMTLKGLFSDSSVIFLWHQ